MNYNWVLVIVFHIISLVWIKVIQGESHPCKAPFPVRPHDYLWLVGGLNPEQYENQLGWLFPIDGKIENVPNHQPDNVGKTMVIAMS